MNAGSSTTIRATFAVVIVLFAAVAAGAEPQIGREVAIRNHLEDGEEFDVPPAKLIAHGFRLFNAMWTNQEGGGRPLTKGVGVPLSDLGSPLDFPRNFNRISAPDANSCGGCHNLPRSGGGGDVVTNVHVLGQRFDHITFDHGDAVTTRGALDEEGKFPTLDQAANSRATLGMFGSGYVEMLARQMTRDMQAIAAGMAPGEVRELISKGVSFGTLARNLDGTWDASAAIGLPAASIASSGQTAPNLIVRPFHQVGAVVSLREFTNNAYNHHHGMQSSERFGPGLDPDGDGFTDELTRADVTAVAVYQATLAAPGRRIPRVQAVEEAVLVGEQAFVEIGCGDCHVPALPLDDHGWVFVEPNPFNPAGNLQSGEVQDYEIDLNSGSLPQPRLRARHGVTRVPAYTDLKLHDISTGPDDPNCEALDQHAAGTPELFDGNCRYLTKKLWGAASEPPYYHHGKYMTLRQAVEAHAGEAQASTDAWRALTDYERDSIIEFMKSLQILPQDSESLVVDADGRPRDWPPDWSR